MRIKVVFIQEFYKVMNRFNMEIELPDGSRVKDLIDKLDREVYRGFKELVLDNEGGIRHPVEIAVNGRRIDFLNGLDTVLRDGDRILFSPRALFVV